MPSLPINDKKYDTLIDNMLGNNRKNNLEQSTPMSRRSLMMRSPEPPWNTRLREAKGQQKLDEMLTVPTETLSSTRQNWRYTRGSTDTGARLLESGEWEHQRPSAYGWTGHLKPEEERLRREVFVETGLDIFYQDTGGVAPNVRDPYGLHKLGIAGPHQFDETGKTIPLGPAEALMRGTGPIDAESVVKWVDSMSSQIRRQEHQKANNEVRMVEQDHDFDLQIVEECDTWLLVEELFVEGEYSPLTDYFAQIWGEEEWDEFVQFQVNNLTEVGDFFGEDGFLGERIQAMSEEERTSLIESEELLGNIGKLKDAIASYITFQKPDLTEPIFLTKDIGDNAQAMLDNQVRRREETPAKTTEAKHIIDMFLDLGIQDMEANTWKIKRQALALAIDKMDPDDPMTAYYDSILMDMDASLVEYSLNNEEMLELLAEKQRINRPRTLDERRIWNTARIFSEIINLKDIPNVRDLDTPISEWNTAIENYVLRASQGEFSHDTNMLILRTYSDSFKAFKVSEETDRIWDNVRDKQSMSEAARSTKVSWGSTMESYLIDPASSDDGAHLSRFIKDNGWNALAPQVQESIIAAVKQINADANAMLRAGMGLPEDVDINILHIEDIMENGDLGIKFFDVGEDGQRVDMDPLRMYGIGAWIMHDNSIHKYKETPSFYRAYGDAMIESMQLLKSEYGTGALMDTEELLTNPEAASKMLVSLAVLGDLRRIAGATRGDGLNLINRIFEGLGDDSFFAEYLRGVSANLGVALNDSSAAMGKSLWEFLDEAVRYTMTPELETMEISQDGKTVSVSPEYAMKLLFDSMSDHNLHQINTLMYLVSPEVIQGTTETSYQAMKHSLNRLTGPLATRDWSWMPGDQSWNLKPRAQNDLEDLRIIYHGDDDGKQWKTEYDALSENSKEILLGVEHPTSRGKVLSIFNMYTNNPTTRDMMESMILSHSIRSTSGTKLRMSQIINQIEGSLGLLEVTMVPVRRDDNGQTIEMGFMPGKGIGIHKILPSLDKDEKDARTVSHYVTGDNSSHVVWIPARERTRENLSLVEGAEEHINLITWQNMVNTFGVYLPAIGMDPDDPKGFEVFKEEILEPMWEQERASWGSQDNKWTARTMLDWSIGAMRKFILDDRVGGEKIEAYAEEMGLFQSGYGTDDYGRLMIRTSSRLITEVRAPDPAGRRGKRGANPKFDIVVQGIGGRERIIRGLGWELSNDMIDRRVAQQERVDQLLADDQLNSTLGGAIAEGVFMNTLALANTVQLLEDWGIIDEGGLDLEGLEENLDKVTGGKVRKILMLVGFAIDVAAGAPKHGPVGRTNMIINQALSTIAGATGDKTERDALIEEMKTNIKDSVEQYRYYNNGEYPHWWNNLIETLQPIRNDPATWEAAYAVLPPHMKVFVDILKEAIPETAAGKIGEKIGEKLGEVLPDIQETIRNRHQ